MKFAANLSMMFTEVGFPDRFQAAAESGFSAVEYLFPYGWEPGLLASKLKDNNLRQVLFNLPPLRRLVSLAVLKLVQAMKLLPAISGTEKEAIDAGTVWVESELFSGKPDFKRLLDQPYPDLSPEEQAFLDGPVEAVCEMTDDWEVFQRRDLPPRVWEFLKRERFFGMIIPPEYEGLGFSPSANSAVAAWTDSSVSSPFGPSAMASSTV